MRSTLHILALTVVFLALACVADARAQDMRVDRLELLEAGFYDTATASAAGTTPAAGTVTGAGQELRGVTLSAAPARAMLRSVWKIPPPGIVNPNDGKTYLESAADFATTIGASHLRGYTFEQPWEVVPGTWTLEIWQGDRKPLDKSFEIKKRE